MASRPVLIAAVTSGVLIVLGILLFFQMRDPIMLVLAIWISALAWIVAFVLYLLRHGIPVRIVADERKP